MRSSRGGSRTRNRLVVVLVIVGIAAALAHIRPPPPDDPVSASLRSPGRGDRDATASAARGIVPTSQRDGRRLPAGPAGRRLVRLHHLGFAHPGTSEGSPFQRGGAISEVQPSQISRARRATPPARGALVIGRDRGSESTPSFGPPMDKVFRGTQMSGPVSFRFEADLLAPVSRWLEDAGFEVRTEVPILGRRADLLGVRPDTLAAIEMKLNDWRGALRQAIAYQVAADRSWVAMPLAAASRAYRQRWYFDVEKVGLLAVDDRGGVRAPIAAGPSPRRFPCLGDRVRGVSRTQEPASL